MTPFESVPDVSGTLRTVRRLYERLLVTLFLLLVTLTLLRIYARLVPRDSVISIGALLWSEAVAEALLVFVVFLAIPVVHYHDRQITINLHDEFIGDYPLYRIFLNLLALVFTGLVAVFGLQRSLATLDDPLQVARFLSYGHLYGAIGVGFAVVSVLIVYRLCVSIRDRLPARRDGGRDE